ncbi:methionine ABC transporter ATP-binding protein [Priestia megaterium]|uniref:Methionine ABC transporter ATP-binding protein n=1 Tax=Priestia megaterium TaxID=1404 RepID=A0A3D8X5C0_PRIMG|nr:methionine ABC transporter ATP-binding protein [Priestia megaterium]MDH3174462.1 methionine ABC transporter ATP-binding protein [Priestia megaterium]RDZ16279.1 methionine ABC transporter ATP-binding protein [Priestia megaterium]
MIKFQRVSKVFGSGSKKVEALKDIELTIQKGDIFGIIGLSGAGKSTLLRTINLLEYPTSGEVIVDGENLAKLSEAELRKNKKRIGMIFQHFNLLNSKTVFENIAMPLILSGKAKKDIKLRVEELLHFVGLEDKAGAYPDHLSGGQKQRVGIARALATNPSILLCDEATSALDPHTTESILKLLKRVNEEYQITIVIITHEMEVIKQICNRVAVMKDGKIIETGNVFDIFSNPRTEIAKNFVQSVVRDDIPQNVYELVQTTNSNQKIFKINFLGSNSGQSVISILSKRFNVQVNILLGNITELQGIPFGHLIIELIGTQEEIDRAELYALQQNIKMEEVVANVRSKPRVDISGFVGNTVHG